MARCKAKVFLGELKVPLVGHLGASSAGLVDFLSFSTREKKEAQMFG